MEDQIGAQSEKLALHGHGGHATAEKEEEEGDKPRGLNGLEVRFTRFVLQLLNRFELGARL